jgi:hypothetical protein
MTAWLITLTLTLALVLWASQRPPNQAPMIPCGD